MYFKLFKYRNNLLTCSEFFLSQIQTFYVSFTGSVRNTALGHVTLSTTNRNQILKKTELKYPMQLSKTARVVRFASRFLNVRNALEC